MVSRLYLEVVRALDARRRALGWSMAYLDDRAGTNDGYFAKCLHADTPSGRQAGWEILQLYADALFPAGCSLVAMPAKHVDHRPARMPVQPPPANDDAPQLSLDVDGRHCTLTSWRRRRRPPRVYRRAGVA